MVSVTDPRVQFLPSEELQPAASLKKRGGGIGRGLLGLLEEAMGTRGTATGTGSEGVKCEGPAEATMLSGTRLS